MKAIKQVYKWIKRLLAAWLILLGIIALLMFLILEVPAVQQFAASKAVAYIQNKFSISLDLQSINIDFPDAISLEEIYLADEQADTLLYCRRLHADIAFFKLLDNTVDVEELVISKLVLNVSRKENKKDFNYQFLIDAFESDATSQTHDTTTASTPWKLGAELINLNEMALTYEDDSSGFYQQLSWADFSANLQILDLENYEISIDKISLKDAISKTELSVADANLKEENNADDSSEISLQTGWDIAIKKLQLDNNLIIFSNKNYPDTIDRFDANHLNISKLNLEIKDISFNDSLLKAAIEQFTFQEESGLSVTDFKTYLLLKEQGEASLKNFRLNTNHSQAALDLSFSYPSLNDLVNLNKQTSLALNLYELDPGYKDLALFIPSEPLADYANIIDSLEIEGSMKGSPVGELLLERLNISITQESQLTLHGQLQEVINPADLGFSIQLDSFVTTKTAINDLLPELLPTQLNLPQNLTTKGLFEGDLQNVDAAISIESNYGNIAIASFWQTDSLQTSRLNGSIELKEYALGELLPGYELGNTATFLNYSLNLPTDGNIGAKATLDIDSLEYSNKLFKEISFDANYQNEKLTLQGTSNNELLDFDLNLNTELKEKQIHELNLILNKADLVQLGLSDSISSVSADVRLTAELSNINDLTAELKIDTAQFIRANKLTELKNHGFVLYQESDSLFFQSNNELLDALIYSNLNLGEIVPEVLGYFDSFIDMGALASDTIKNDYLSLRLQTYESPVWQELIVPGLEHASPISLSLLYEQASKQMEIDLQTDSLAYNGVNIDKLNFTLSGEEGEFNMQFGSNKVSTGPLALYEPAIGIIINNDTAYTNVLVKDSIGNANFVLNTQLNKKYSSFYLHINADTLLLSGNTWQVSPDNYLLIQKNDITVNNFSLRNQEQALRINSIEDKRDSLLVSFEEFEVGNFLEAIGFTEKELSGKLQGDILLSQLFTNFQFKTDLSIDSINLYEVPVGNLHVQAENTTQEKYTFDLALKGMGNDMEMNGNMLLEENTKLDIAADVNAIDLEVLEGLSGGALQNVKGYIAGDLSVNGLVTDPIITGDVEFFNTAFLVSYLNSTFNLDNQKIIFEPSSINLNNLLIKDSENNEARVNGKIIKNSLTDYELNLKLKANNFKALDTKQGDNELYYGKVKVNSEIDIIGDLLTPTIDMSVELLEGSEVTYVVPEDELLVEDQKGIIEFIQITEEDTLIMSKDTLVDNTLTGFDLNMNIEINEDTKFIVLIDEDAGDKLEVEGEGDLVFGLQRNGNMTLTGRYIINNGFYLLTFYGLVKKQFALADGSSVVWRGDPYNAALSIQAIYETRTSPQTLMANAGNDASQYTRPEIFQVLMNIRGELAKPQISFELDMPQEERGNASIYNTVRLLNQNEAELNKQVFALLVLNSFIAINSSNQDIGDDFISSTARSSVSQLLTQQLNNLSEKFIKGIQLDLNLESYGSGSQAGTDLQVGISKSLLDDRITLEVGGSYQLEGEEQAGNNNLIGNVAIEYKITEDGRYRLRFFQMNDTNILDGQVTSKGLSIIFTRDYDKLKHLFRKKKDETQ